METAYPALWQFFGGYFHQDWDLAGPGWRDVVAGYIDEAGPEIVRQTADELAVLLRDVSDEDALRGVVLDGFGCFYLPDPDGVTMRAWLEEVRQALERG